MGRFFQTAPTQFVEDYIYQPPWEIIQQNNMLKAQNYATQQQTFNLLNNLPIDFWDKPDSELAKAKQEEYRNLTEPLIKTLQKDPNNKQAELQLHDIANKVYQDYTYGDLAKLRKNKEQHDKFMEYAEKLPPGDKEVFLRQMDNYLKPNQDGSMNNAFTKQFDFMEHQNMIKGEDYFKTDRFKTLEADIDSNAGVNIGGQWLIKNSSNIEELKQAKIAEDMKAWVQEQNLDKNNWDKYWTQVGGIQNLYDKEGKLGFEKGTYFGDMIEAGSKTHAYKKTKSDKDVDENPSYAREHAASLQEAAAARQHKRDLDVARASAITPSNDPSVPVYTDKLFSGHGDIETFINNTFGNSAKRLGITPRQYMSRVRMNADKFKGTWSMAKLQEIDKMANNLRIANKDDFEKKFPGRGKEIQQLFINNAKLGNQLYLIPSNNSTHESYKRSFNDLRNGKITINGIKPKKGTAEIISSEIMIIPASTFEGSTIVYPVEFQDTKGEVHTEYIYKNIAEAYKQK
mgnify:CR=1 FL=1